LSSQGLAVLVLIGTGVIVVRLVVVVVLIVLVVPEIVVWVAVVVVVRVKLWHSTWPSSIKWDVKKRSKKEAMSANHTD
jgi:hypothetical protein